MLRITMPVDAPMPWVDPRDVGDVAAARLLATDWSGRQVQAVHGPEHLTYAQAAAIISRATGRPLRAEQIPDDQMRAALRAAGLGDTQVEAVLGMSTGLRQDFVPEGPAHDPHHDPEHTGILGTRASRNPSSTERVIDASRVR